MTGRRSSSRWWLLCFLLHIIAVSRGGILRSIPGLPTIYFIQPGDINLGLVTTMHRFQENTLCGPKIRELGALQRLEGVVFAVDEINNRSDILPSVTLGFVVVDDCYNIQTAQARALHFIQCANPYPVSGFVVVDDCYNIQTAQARALHFIQCANPYPVSGYKQQVFLWLDFTEPLADRSQLEAGC